MSPGEILMWLGIMMLFIFLNGLFVAVEFSLIALRKSRVQEMVDQGQPLAGSIQKLQKDMDNSIAGAQLGITLASLALGWVGEHSIQEAVALLLGWIPWLEGIQVPAGFGFAISFLVLSVLHVVLGEQVPKSWSLKLPEWTCKMLVVPFRLFCVITFPLIWVMNGMAAIILKILRVEKKGADEHPAHSADELEILFDASHKAGELNRQEKNLLKRALELEDITVGQIMIPRVRMDSISDGLSFEEVMEIVAKTKHGKLPVFHGSTDQIAGVLLTRDLFDLWHEHLQKAQVDQAGGFEFSLNSIVRTAYHVPESMPADMLLQELKERQIQMAIVVDEFGGTSGLITLEDLLEQLVGEIWDEYDTPHTGVKEVSTGVWEVSGETTRYELKLATGVDLFCHTCVTVAGAVVEAYGRLPKPEESVVINNHRFTVVETLNHAIVRLKVERIEAS